MQKKQWLIIFVVLCMLLSGCGVQAATQSSPQTNNGPVSLNITRINMLPSNHYQPFAPRTITDQHAVQQLYNAMLALPHPFYNGQARTCPADLGLEYRLDFSRQNSPLKSAMMDMGGCRAISLGENDMRIYDETFLRLLAQTVEVSITTLDARPLYSCTPHSPCPTPTAAQ